jgi:ABC-type lipoprotein release transport system permease subunit
MASKETVVLISLYTRAENKPSNVTVRGIGPLGAALRTPVKLASGRMFRPGSNEVVAGRGIANKFVGAGVGEVLHFGSRDWVVTGVIESDGSGFDSEIWGDADQLMPAFRRPVFSSMVLRLNEPKTFDALKARIEADPRFNLEAKRERQYYTDQSEALATFINILGLALTAIFSIGAVIGAMITMYAAVANRVGEIGTLRALGFRRGAVMAAFLLESLFIALVAGVVGLVFASGLQWITVSTMNFQSFAELAFSFQLTPAIIAKVLLFSLAMGFIGGFLPAARAARMNIVTALRSA